MRENSLERYEFIIFGTDKEIPEQYASHCHKIHKGNFFNILDEYDFRKMKMKVTEMRDVVKYMKEVGKNIYCMKTTKEKLLIYGIDFNDFIKDFLINEDIILTTPWGDEDDYHKSTITDFANVNYAVFLCNRPYDFSFHGFSILWDEREAKYYENNCGLYRHSASYWVNRKTEEIEGE